MLLFIDAPLSWAVPDPDSIHNTEVINSDGNTSQPQGRSYPGVCAEPPPSGPCSTEAQFPAPRSPRRRIRCRVAGRPSGRLQYSSTTFILHQQQWRAKRGGRGGPTTHDALAVHGHDRMPAARRPPCHPAYLPHYRCNACRKWHTLANLRN